MRCENITVTLHIPVPINKPDGNGTMYTEEAIKEACKKSEKCPIIQYNNKGEEVVIGIANKIRYSDGFIIVEGLSRYGGISDLVETFDGKTVSSMSFSGIGLCE